MDAVDELILAAKEILEEFSTGTGDYSPAIDNGHHCPSRENWARLKEAVEKAEGRSRTKDTSGIQIIEAGVDPAHQIVKCDWCGAEQGKGCRKQESDGSKNIQYPDQGASRRVVSEQNQRPANDVELAVQCLQDIANPQRGPKEQMSVKLECPDWLEIPLGMSNFDHTIDDGLDVALRSGEVQAKHAGWNFNGNVWFAGGQFHEEVWQYRVPVAIVSATTLEDLMKTVNDRFGWE